MKNQSRGYFGIGIVNGKTPSNFGTLWRTAYQLGASFTFTVGCRYERAPGDTPKSWRHVPAWRFKGPDDMAVPFDCVPVAIEMGGTPLDDFEHPERAIYMLGSEDGGLPRWALDRCVHRVSLPFVRVESFNVAVAGALVMADRFRKLRTEGCVLPAALSSWEAKP